MDFSAAMNNVLNITSQISNKSEPQGFSVNMKPHFVFSLVPLFWLSQILVPPRYRIWSYINIPSFWGLPRLSTACKGTRAFHITKMPKNKIGNQSNPTCAEATWWGGQRLLHEIVQSLTKDVIVLFILQHSMEDDFHVILESQRWARKSALKGKDEREKLSLDGPLQAKMKNLRSPGSHKQQDWKVYREWGGWHTENGLNRQQGGTIYPNLSRIIEV